MYLTVHNVFITASVGIDAETAFKGDSVFNVTATDPEDDIVTFSMTCTAGGAANTDTFTILASKVFSHMI